MGGTEHQQYTGNAVFTAGIVCNYFSVSLGQWTREMSYVRWGQLLNSIDFFGYYENGRCICSTENNKRNPNYYNVFLKTSLFLFPY